MINIKIDDTLEDTVIQIGKDIKQVANQSLTSLSVQHNTAKNKLEISANNLTVSIDTLPMKNVKGEIVGYLIDPKTDNGSTAKIINNPTDTPTEETTENKLIWKVSNSDDELVINNSQENWLNEVIEWDIVDSDGNSVAFDKNEIDSRYKITFESIENGLSVIDVAVDYSESVSGSVAMFREKIGEQSKEFQPFFKRSISLSAQKTNDTWKAKLTIECLSDEVSGSLTAVISEG